VGDITRGRIQEYKVKEVHLKAYQDRRDARVGIGNYFRSITASVPARP
jgi:hypothetical protein